MQGREIGKGSGQPLYTPEDRLETLPDINSKAELQRKEEAA